LRHRVPRERQCSEDHANRHTRGMVAHGLSSFWYATKHEHTAKCTHRSARSVEKLIASHSKTGAMMTEPEVSVPAVMRNYHEVLRNDLARPSVHQNSGQLTYPSFALRRPRPIHARREFGVI
jgi:hypothetical protein